MLLSCLLIIFILGLQLLAVLLVGYLECRFDHTTLTAHVAMLLDLVVFASPDTIVGYCNINIAMYQTEIVQRRSLDNQIQKSQPM